MTFEWTPSRKALVRIVAGATVIVLVATGVLTYRACLPGVAHKDGRAFAASLAPSSSDAMGVSPGSPFVLTLGEPVPLAAVRSAFSVEPAVEFTVRAADREGKVYRIEPKAPLEPDRVYRFRLALAGPDEPGYSWAFQVRGELRVVGTLPGNRSSYVPLQTGIEVEFSHGGVKDPTSFFDISPFVPGTWEGHRRTWVYVPAAPLRDATIYTCTVKKGLGVEGSDQTLAEDYVFSFETVSLQAPAKGPGYTFWVDTSAAEFPPTETPFFRAGFGWNDGDTSRAGPKVAVKVFRYKDAAAYVAGLGEREKIPWWASAGRQKFEPSTVGLAPALQADLDLQTVEGRTYLVLPEALPAGYYLAFFRVEPYTYYAWLQVTDLSSYLIEASNDTVLWFNSLAAGAPAAGVVVRPVDGGPPLGNSGQDGVARFPTPAVLTTPPSAAGEDSQSQARRWMGASKPFYVVARAPDGAESVINLVPGWYGLDEASRMAGDYWTYLFTDRPLYLPNDVVRFWGVLEPIDPGTSEIGQVDVVLGSSYAVWEGPFGGEPSTDVIASEPVSVLRHTFTGNVTLPNLRPGWYHLDLRKGDTVLASQYFEVATYTKPAYRLSLTAGKRAIFAGESVRFSLGASFFEGTPVPELRLDYSLSSGRSGSLVTDADGRASLDYTAPQGDPGYGVERRDSMYVSADLPEAGFIYANAGVRVFERDVAMRASLSQDAAGATIQARLNRVTLEWLNAAGATGGAAGATGGAAGSTGGAGEGPQPPELGYLGDPVAGREIKGQVFRIRWEARETGQYYDFVAKLVRKTYEYREVRDPVQTFAVTTDQSGVAAWSFVPEKGQSYLITLTSIDDKGRTIASDVSVYGEAYTWPQAEWHYYHLDAAGRDRPVYDIGETVTLAARDREASIPARPGGFLFYVARKGLGPVEVKDVPEYSFTFREDQVPNTNVGAVYFDGRYYNALWDIPVTYKYKMRELQVAVTTDKESYRPGDRVVVGVEVKDREGRPVGAEVNLSAVDEALFALSGQRVDLLGSLYSKRVWDYILLTRGSHEKRLAPGGGAEQGEGGGERKEFLDAAYFGSVTTGTDGKATVEFTLPDNLTSWRLTYQAFAPGVRAGSGSIDIPVRLPFFVGVSMNETYLSGDEPVVLARAYGSALASASPVSFVAKLARLGPDGKPESEKEVRAEGQAFRPIDLALGRLEKGRYSLKLTGTSAGAGAAAEGSELADTVVLPFEVVDTYLRVDRVDYYEVKEGLRVTGQPGELATLTFTDRERGKYLEMLWRLAGGGARADMRAAEAVARRLLVERFGYDETFLGPAPTASALLVYQQRGDGGIGLLPYADSNLELTAKIAALEAAAGVGFDRDGLRAYLGAAYDDEGATRERLIVALYGLAALGEPVLGDVQHLAAEPDLSVKEKLYTALALIELGDEEDARAVFSGVLEKYGDRVGPLLRLNVSRDPEEIIPATSLAAMVEAKLKLPDKLALFEYLLDNSPWEELNLLEAALFVEAALPAGPSEAARETLGLTLGPDGTNVKIEPGGSYTLVRRSADLPALTFSNVRGNVGLMVAYRGPIDLGRTHARAGEATLTRTYSVKGRATHTFGPGDLVKVTVSFKIFASAPEGSWQLVDFLPSGLKVVPRAYEVGMQDANLRCPIEVDGQKVTFSVYVEHPTDPKTGKVLSKEGSGTVTYYARVVSLGTSQADPAVLQHVKSGDIFAATEKDVVTIR